MNSYMDNGAVVRCSRGPGGEPPAPGTVCVVSHWRCLASAAASALAVRRHAREPRLVNRTVKQADVSLRSLAPPDVPSHPHGTGCAGARLVRPDGSVDLQAGRARGRPRRGRLAAVCVEAQHDGAEEQNLHADYPKYLPASHSRRRQYSLIPC